MIHNPTHAFRAPTGAVVMSIAQRRRAGLAPLPKAANPKET